MSSFIDDLAADGLDLNNLDRSSSPAPKAKVERTTFPCESCGGSGYYRGARVHQEKAHCFACKGKGYFFSSKSDRMKSRASSAARKAAALEIAKDNFHAEFPGLIEAMTALVGWNAFVADLLRQFNERGTLTANQAAAAQRQVEKAAARDAERAAAKANAPTVDLANVWTLLNTAKGNGLKKPGLWFGALKITEAPATGQNAGALYVKMNGEYAGKIVGSQFKAAWGVKADGIVADLLAIATSPAEALKAKGKETGRCCCCGRELTDPVSVANGIGPICEENFGL